MELNEFINKYKGKKVDFDGVYGAQCVDLFRQYCQDVLNIPHTGSVNGAKELITEYERLPLEVKYFQLLNPAHITQGDVLVWNSTNKNKYGHVAIVVAPITNTDVIVFEQDGFRQDGAKLNLRSMQNVIGALRVRR